MPVKRYIKTGDGSVEAKTYTARYVFPALHPNAPEDKHERDRLYRERVEGRPLTTALSDARSFLESC